MPDPKAQRLKGDIVLPEVDKEAKARVADVNDARTAATTAVNNEATARANADTAEANTRGTEDTKRVRIMAEDAANHAHVPNDYAGYAISQCKLTSASPAWPGGLGGLVETHYPTTSAGAGFVYQEFYAVNGGDRYWRVGLNGNTWSGWHVLPSRGYVDTKVAKSGDTMTGILDMGLNRIIGVPVPGANGHATNKSYVDSRTTPGPWVQPGLLNGWVANTNHSTPAYRLSPASGEVQFVGRIKSGTTTNDTTLFTITAESGCRPPAVRSMIALEGDLTAAEIFVLPTGEVKIWGVTNNISLTLDGLSFAL